MDALVGTGSWSTWSAVCSKAVHQPSGASLTIEPCGAATPGPASCALLVRRRRAAASLMCCRRTSATESPRVLSTSKGLPVHSIREVNVSMASLSSRLSGGRGGRAGERGDNGGIRRVQPFNFE